MKLLVAILSCHTHRGLHQAQRDTWIRDLGSVDYRFFLGGPGQAEQDEVLLDVDDSYEGLSRKTRELARWATDYDFVYKTDTDTVVNVGNLLSSGFDQHDYFGGSNADNVAALSNAWLEFASGGAGYWLSKRARAIVVNSEVLTPAEDVFVAMSLKPAGITPVWHSGYRWRPGETVDANLVSLHLSSATQKKYTPEMMYEHYRVIASGR